MYLVREKNADAFARKSIPFRNGIHEELVTHETRMWNCMYFRINRCTILDWCTVLFWVNSWGWRVAAEVTSWWDTACPSNMCHVASSGKDRTEWYRCFPQRATCKHFVKARSPRRAPSKSRYTLQNTLHRSMLICVKAIETRALAAQRWYKYLECSIMSSTERQWTVFTPFSLATWQTSPKYSTTPSTVAVLPHLTRRYNLESWRGFTCRMPSNLSNWWYV